VIVVRPTSPRDSTPCVDVLAQLPEYFTSDARDELRHGFDEHRSWVADDDGEIVGFITCSQRYPAAAEIRFAAVVPERRRAGIGTQLMQHIMRELANEGTAIVLVKTLDASAGYEPYVATRAFWEQRGFVQIDCIDPLPGWQPGNPSAIYVASLRTTLEAKS
jgi:GNAT superfamily N-acetyltransferase